MNQYQFSEGKEKRGGTNPTPAPKPPTTPPPSQTNKNN